MNHDLGGAGANKEEPKKLFIIGAFEIEIFSYLISRISGATSVSFSSQLHPAGVQVGASE